MKIALVVSLLSLPLSLAQGELPRDAESPPFVTLAPAPVAPRVPSSGRPWFSVVTKDKGSHYEVYATVENAAPKDVRVELEGGSLKLVVPPAKRGEKPSVQFVTLPKPALAEVGKVKRESHAIKFAVPKAKRNPSRISAN